MTEVTGALAGPRLFPVSFDDEVVMASDTVDGGESFDSFAVNAVDLISTTTRAGWGDRDVVPSNLFCKSSKITEEQCRMWDASMCGSDTGLMRVRAELDGFKKRLKQLIKGQIHMKYVSVVKKTYGSVNTHRDLVNLYTKTQGSLALHTSMWEAMYNIWSYPNSYELELEEIVKEHSGWLHYTTTTDGKKRKGFIREEITGIKASVAWQLRSSRKKYGHSDYVQEREENTDRFSPDGIRIRGLRGTKLRKEKRVFDQSFIRGWDPVLGVPAVVPIADATQGDRRSLSVMDRSVGRIEERNRELERKVALLQRQLAGSLLSRARTCL